MGIYIKGMKLPKPGQIVLVEIDENGDVSAAYDGGRTKLADYKAIHIPSHGGLIDVDALSYFPYNMDFCDGYEADEWVQSAPIVIPADEDEI